MSDRVRTSLQESGTAVLYEMTLAELVEDVAALGVEPSTVIVAGHVGVGRPPWQQRPVPE